MRRPPLLLERFDQGRRWAAFSEKTYTSVAVLPPSEQPESVQRQGRSALRLDYDFRFETTQCGSRRSYCHTVSTAENHLELRQALADCPDTLVIPEGEYPTHLGIWLYGDGSTAWINGGIVDANGVMEDIAYGDQDWMGWRFVTGAVPPGLRLPLYVSYPLRLLSGSKTMHGSVWLGGVTALYGGIDYDVVPPVIDDISFADGSLTAYVYDPDDSENHFPASGIDCSRTELYIDGHRHRKHITLVPEGRGFALSCLLDFALCGGWHRAGIAVYDREGNAGRKSAFFRSGEGIAWEMPSSARLGQVIDLDVTGVDGGCEAPHVDWDCHGALEPLGPRQLRVKHGLPGPERAGVRCVAGHYTKNGERFSFCLPDLQIELAAGLELVMRHFCRGFDAQFLVRDLQGRPMPGAKICCDGVYLEGVTDANGILPCPGLTDREPGTGIEAFASRGDEYSYTRKANLSRDFAQALPANVVLTLRAPAEIGVTWQCGIGTDAGCVQYAEQLDALDDGPLVPAEASPFYTVLHGQYTELSAFRAVLRELAPGQRYLYRVGNPLGWSPVYAFQTPKDGPAVTFAVLGDTHNKCGDAMASALRRSPAPDFFLHAGDYVGSGGAYGDWLALHGDSRGLLPEHPVLPVVGNHDTMDGDGAHYRMVFHSPDNGPPGTRPGMTYACEIGAALFIALGDMESEQATVSWLLDVLGRSSKKWRILFLHSGPYTCWINTEEYEKKLSGLAQRLGFDLVLSGHDHVYHRATVRDHITQPAGAVIDASQGVTYVQCGTSGHGQDCGGDHRPIWNKIHESPRPVYALISVRDDKIAIQGVELSDEQPEGVVFDEVAIVKP
ncbi:MAG: metallophosphoesterase [Oscillospiraceae bacterium]|nr:metallophosphoesterase [Oscillospiraceae bacterium]